MNDEETQDNQTPSPYDLWPSDRESVKAEEKPPASEYQFHRQETDDSDFSSSETLLESPLERPRYDAPVEFPFERPDYDPYEEQVSFTPEEAHRFDAPLEHPRHETAEEIPVDLYDDGPVPPEEFRDEQLEPTEHHLEPPDYPTPTDEWLDTDRLEAPADIPIVPTPFGIMMDEPFEPPFVPVEYVPDTTAETVRRSGLAWSAGVVFFGSVAFMLFLGWLADLILGTSPWGLVGGILLGSIIGFIQFFRITSQIFAPKKTQPEDRPFLSRHEDEE